MAGDPDPGTREEMRAILASGDRAALAERLEKSLTFGTAGIRGEVGAGPNRMNRAVVIRTTGGLAAYLFEEHGAADAGPVVVGFDARPDSRRFAEDTVGVLAAAGIAVAHFPDPVPTPLVAFATKRLQARAAVVITASHNPPGDNGYKVYGGNAAQIIPPVDARIAAAIDRLGPATEIPRLERPVDGGHDLVEEVPEDIFERYWEEVDRWRPRPTPSALKVVYTPLHGVGGETMTRVMERAGHTGLLIVPEQYRPDGAFPTVAFPNPEEPGSLDLALEMAEATDADLVIANDPDADRLAVAVPQASGKWRMLSGDEVGILLGDHLLTHHRNGKTPIVVSTIVSSLMMPRVAADHGAHHELTLTGFKWIVNAGLALEEKIGGRFVFGYEEALGYMVGSTVRDKDGISAALVVCDLAAELAEQGGTLLDRLAALWRRTGVWASAQLSVTGPREQGAEKILAAVEQVAARPPPTLGGHAVGGVEDYRRGAENRPPWLGKQDLIQLSLGEQGRVLVRPSGTEAKLKIYADLTAEPGPDPFRRHASLLEDAKAMSEELASWLVL